jgi:hypothetical protein
MVHFACPQCQTQFDARPEQRGQVFHCTRCGQRLEVPSDSADAKGAATADVPVEVLPVSPLTVRWRTREETRKFRTSCGLRKLDREVDEMLDRLGLSLDEEGNVFGQLRHGNSFFCTASVDGLVRHEPDRQEYLIDFSWRTSMSTAAILIAIFLFPVGLILAIVFYQMGQNDVKRLFEDAFRNLRSDLADRDRDW